MAISVSQSAAKHISDFLSKRGKGMGIRLGVRTSGCSVKVYTDAKSLTYLDGTELDFVREGLNEGFKFNNPNVKNQCGCGESFNV